MKKFNLKKALQGDEVMTRGGFSVILTGSAIGKVYNLLGVVSTPCGFERQAWTVEGRFLFDRESDCDLVMV